MISYKIVKASTTFKIGSGVSVTVINTGKATRLQVQAPKGIPVVRVGDEKFRYVANPSPQLTADELIALASL